MQSHRILSGLTILLMVVLVAVGYFVVAQPQLAASSAASLQLASVESQIAGAQTAVVTLKAEQQKLPALKEQLAALRLSIPSSVDSSLYINGLTALASANGVTITALTVSDPQSYVPPVGSAVATTPATGASASPTPTPSPSADAVPAPVSTAWAPTTDPLITGSTFVVIPVKVTVAGPMAHTLGFAKGLQSGSRLFLVSGLNLSHDAVNPANVSMGIDGYIYVILDPKAAAAASTKATTATPTPTASPTVTTSPSGTATPTPSQSPTPTTKP